MLLPTVALWLLITTTAIRDSRCNHQYVYDFFDADWMSGRSYSVRSRSYRLIRPGSAVNAGNVNTEIKIKKRTRVLNEPRRGKMNLTSVAGSRRDCYQLFLHLSSNEDSDVTTGHIANRKPQTFCLFRLYSRAWFEKYWCRRNKNCEKRYSLVKYYSKYKNVSRKYKY